MTTKPLLLLAALTLFCYISTLHAFPRSGCSCIRTTSNTIPLRVIKKIEVIPISGHCRWIEIIITRRNGSKVCVSPTASWVIDYIRDFQKKNMAETTVSPTAATTNF
ncbi:interleukin-8 [Dicentrarchus labrax]|nr:interleukin-8 [Dicentrarchus labrax]AIK66545.1 c-X-C motif chemokine 13 [Dicentrarchus labrax]